MPTYPEADLKYFTEMQITKRQAWLIFKQRLEGKKF